MPGLRRLARLGLAPGALLAALFCATGAAAQSRPAFDGATAALCDRAISAAATRRGTPERLLRALSHVESGRSVEGARRAWPWTVNAGGEGRWFSTKAEALAFAARKRAAGVRSIDLGCLQINTIWHGMHFTGLSEMLDPDVNADYAAKFLSDLKAETGDWMRAAGYYHSRTAAHFNRYSALVRTAYGALEGIAAPVFAATRRAAAPHEHRPGKPGPRRRLTAAPAIWDGLLRRSRGGLFGFSYGAGGREALLSEPLDQIVPADVRPESPAAAAPIPVTVAAPASAGGVAMTFDRPHGGGGARGAGLYGAAPKPLAPQRAKSWLKP